MLTHITLRLVCSQHSVAHFSEALSVFLRQLRRKSRRRTRSKEQNNACYSVSVLLRGETTPDRYNFELPPRDMSINKYYPVGIGLKGVCTAHRYCVRGVRKQLIPTNQCYYHCISQLNPICTNTLLCVPVYRSTIIFCLSYEQLPKEY